MKPAQSVHRRNDMEMRELGRTGMKVSVLGLGLAEIPRHDDSSGDLDLAGRVLGNALDNGINFLDTAACYGETEEMIGRAVSHRRSEYYLATKAGHVTGGETGEPWSAEVVEASIDRSLRRLRTDHVDLVQIHTCPMEELLNGEVIEALERARDAGKTRFIGHSGDNEEAAWAVGSGRFDTLQTSYNLVEQRARTKGLFEAAETHGVGVIIKRPVANGVWGKQSAPYSYGEEYFQRYRAMIADGPIQGDPGVPHVLAMGFVLARQEVDTIIVGTHNPDHVVSNVKLVQDDLPIADEAVDDLYRRFDKYGADWRQRT